MKNKVDSKELVILCDVDGTIALMKGKRSPFEYEKAIHDSPNAPIIRLVRRMMENTDYKLIFFSAREDRVFDDSSAFKSAYHLTHTWLEKYFDKKDYNWDLHLRSTGDHRKDCYVKYDMYKEYIEDKYKVLYVIDDRNQVVDMWRNGLGLTCLQVADGNF